MSLYKDASLVMIPSAYKDGKLYSIRPTDGSGDFTFSRGSNLAATRVDVNGLIEKGRENILVYSNDFSQSDWAKTGIASVSGNQVGYDGSNDAYLITSNGVTINHYLRQGASTQSGVQTYSVYAKGNGYDFQLRATGVGGTTNWVSFNLVSGSVGTSGAGIIESKMTSMGNGWYRCSATFNDSGSPFIGIYLVEDADTAGSGPSYTGDGVSGVFLQDAQVEKGLVATDYIETTSSTAQAGILEDMPRLDYSGGASCPALLLEPQRTNLINYSEYISSSTYSFIASGTGSVPVATPNYAISPDGKQNATRVVLDKGIGATSGDYSSFNQSITLTGDATFSVYLKSATGDDYVVSMRMGNNRIQVTATSEWQRFDFSDSGLTYATSGIWLRGGYSSDDYADILVYGIQTEAGSYPTSYIPTYGASVTRSGDTCFNDTDDFAGTDQVTLFAELDNNGNDRTGGYFRFSLNYFTSSAEWIFLGYESGKAVRFYVRSNATTSVDRSAGNYGAGILKMAAKIDSEGNYKLFANGVEIAYGSNAVFSPSLNRINIGSTSGLTNMEDRVKQLVIFPTALTDSECIALTTL